MNDPCMGSYMPRRPAEILTIKPPHVDQIVHFLKVKVRIFIDSFANLNLKKS